MSFASIETWARELVGPEAEITFHFNATGKRWDFLLHRSQDDRASVGDLEEFFRSYNLEEARSDWTRLLRIFEESWISMLGFHSSGEAFRVWARYDLFEGKNRFTLQTTFSGSTLEKAFLGLRHEMASAFRRLSHFAGALDPGETPGRTRYERGE